MPCRRGKSGRGKSIATRLPEHNKSSPPRPTQCRCVSWEPLRGCQALFDEAVHAQQSMNLKRIAHQLAQQRSISAVGDQATEVFVKEHMRILDAGQFVKAVPVTMAFLADMALLCGCQSEDIPLLVLWDLNSLASTSEEEKRGWLTRSNAFTSLLAAKAARAMGVVLGRKTTTSMSRTQFHQQILVGMEAAGLDVDSDIALHFERQHGNSRASGCLRGWCAFVPAPGGNPPDVWAGTELLQHGSVLGIPQACLMLLSLHSCFAAHATHLSLLILVSWPSSFLLCSPFSLLF